LIAFVARTAVELDPLVLLAPVRSLFQGVRFGVVRVERSSSMVILLGLREDDMVRCNA
jgi:hypothetical protein